MVTATALWLRTVYQSDHFQHRGRRGRIAPAMRAGDSIRTTVGDAGARFLGWAAEREFDVPFTFLLRRATSGAAIGADNIRLHVDSAGTHLSSNFENTITDPAGNSLFTATGTYDATPI